MRALPSWPHLIFITSCIPCRLIPSHCGVGWVEDFNVWIWGEWDTGIQSITMRHTVHTEVLGSCSNAILIMSQQMQRQHPFYTEQLSLAAVWQTASLWYRVYVLFIFGEVFHNAKLYFPFWSLFPPHSLWWYVILSWTFWGQGQLSWSFLCPWDLIMSDRSYSINVYWLNGRNG